MPITIHRFAAAIVQNAVVSVALELSACTITARVCKNFPAYSRKQFRDSLGEEHAETGSNEAACLKRAEDFHHWCGNDASGGAVVAATFNQKQWTQMYHPNACDAGWSQWDAFCYKYFWEMKTWPEAEELCRQRNAHLVSIHSQAENRFVATLQHGLKGWIGYSDLNKDTHYEWSDNTQDDFTNFAKNCTGRESEPDCKPEEVQQQWYSSSGVSTSPYTCKRNALVAGLKLLVNTSAERLTTTSWQELLPALAGASSGGTSAAMSTVESPQALKLKEVAKPPSGTRANGIDGGAMLEPRIRLPKGLPLSA